MEEHADIITTKNIKKYGYKARNDFKPVQGNCGKIADRFTGYLIDYVNLPYKNREIVDKYGVKHIRVGPEGEEKHFVFFIDGHFIEDYSTGDEIIIDLSFDQFNEENKEKELVSVSYGKKEKLDKIRIMNPYDNRLNQYILVSEYMIG